MFHQMKGQFRINLFQISTNNGQNQKISYLVMVLIFMLIGLDTYLTIQLLLESL
jgi:hypothetical protein